MGALLNTDCPHPFDHVAPGASPSEAGALQWKVDFSPLWASYGGFSGAVLSPQSFSSTADTMNDTLGTFCEDLKPCVSVVLKIFWVGR